MSIERLRQLDAIDITPEQLDAALREFDAVVADRDEQLRVVEALTNERNGLLARVVEVEKQVRGLAKMRAEQDGKLVAVSRELDAEREEADAADAMWRERLRVAEEQVAESVLREGEAVKRADTLEAALKAEVIEVSAERSLCRRCHTNTFGALRGRETHVHYAHCILYARDHEPKVKPDAALPYTLEGA